MLDTLRPNVSPRRVLPIDIGIDPMSEELPTLDLRLAEPDPKHDKWGPLFLLDEAGPHVRLADRLRGKDRDRSLDGLSKLRYAWPVTALTDPIAGCTNPVGILDENGAALVHGATYDDLFVGHPMRALIITHLVTNDIRPASMVGLRGSYGWLSGSTDEALQFAAETRSDLSIFDDLNEHRDQMGMVERGMLGTGYTSFTRPNDGGSSFGEVVLPLADGSVLLGWATLWFNK
jgi:hypothetical protein